ncbi:holo-ACP synthase [Undibacterium fentianense]|uniref:Holo-[acyl-carrier-protein] synthase n=1 Tax=Undibacterium fentianense TaxID=2828728 RepID=A0A941E0W4_9BURK|nr:holo-ACP synthase [Undibacterium fentianense]MBR7800315.1 holo-ACP synthase [Undibacterium fentianense]
MIFGIGTDIVKISRIRGTFSRHPERFVTKILGTEEQIHYHTRAAQSSTRAIHFLATRFAAKEAFSKAIGLGIRYPMKWHSVQVRNNDFGRPQFYFENDLANWMKSHHLAAHLSVSDETEFAIAYVIVEQSSKNYE